MKHLSTHLSKTLSVEKNSIVHKFFLPSDMRIRPSSGFKDYENSRHETVLRGTRSGLDTWAMRSLLFHTCPLSHRQLSPALSQHF